MKLFCACEGGVRAYTCMGYSLIEMAEYKELISIDWNIVFTIGNTLILFFVLKHFLYEKVKKVLNSR
ncbi:MAG: hypothetical protein WAX04_12165, partial [Oscillospiraceae bacterium]